METVAVDTLNKLNETGVLDKLLGSNPLNLALIVAFVLIMVYLTYKSKDNSQKIAVSLGKIATSLDERDKKYSGGIEDVKDLLLNVRSDVNEGIQSVKDDIKQVNIEFVRMSSRPCLENLKSKSASSEDSA